MKRLYYYVYDMEEVAEIEQEVHQIGIDDSHFHVYSQDKSGLDNNHVHSTNLFQETDMINDAEKGFLFGLLITAIIVFTNSLIGLSMSIEMLALTAVMLCAFGTWLGGFVGVQTVNHHLVKFSSRVKEGAHLMLIDVKQSQIKKVKGLMQLHAKGSEYAGEEDVLLATIS